MTRDVLPAQSPHTPVLLTPLLAACAPVSGVWLDGTFGAGSYARGMLAAGADLVIGVDRDPLAFDLAAPWIGEYGDRLRLVAGNFSSLDVHAGQALDGVVLDLGVSSMQLDLAERGFSFAKDGPLDMRMAQTGDTIEWHAGKGEVVFHTGAQAFVYSAECYEKLRGPEHSHAWCDELSSGTTPMPPGTI